MEMIGPGSAPPAIHVQPSGLNLIAGSLVGDVTDIQTWQDGNLLQLEEVAATPGQDLEILFTNMIGFRRVVVSMYYSGSATHWIEIQIFDWIAVAWKTLWTFTSGNGLNYRYSDIPVRSDDFVDAGGNAKLRICHPAAGNAAHDSFIDYASLVR